MSYLARWFSTVPVQIYLSRIWDIIWKQFWLKLEESGKEDMEHIIGPAKEIPGSLVHAGYTQLLIIIFIDFGGFWVGWKSGDSRG